MTPIKPDSRADTSPSTTKRNKRVFEETAASSRPKRGTAGPPAKRTRSSAVGANDNGNGNGTAVASASASASTAAAAGKGRATKGKSKVVRKAAPAKAPAPAATAAKKAGRPIKTKNCGRRASNAGASGTTEEVEDAPASNGAIEEDEVDEDDKSYWLMKAEPESRMEKGADVKFSIDDLREAEEPEPWDGVRNAAARNHMRAMKKGDLAFFYHSNCKIPGIAGIMEIVQEHSIDESAFDTAHPYYDPKSSRENPKWEVVHVEFRQKFKELVRLSEIKSFANPGGALEDLSMVKQGRLSVSPVNSKQWRFIMSLAEELEEDGDKKE